MNFFKTTFNDEPWVVYLVDDDDDVVATDDAEAEIDLQLKEIYFRKGMLTIEKVRHELWHLYFNYCFVETANLEMAQVEEVTCELFAYRGPTIIQRADEMFAQLLQLKKQMEIDDAS